MTELPMADLTGKARIRQVALHLFATRGCANTPLRLIAEKAHVSLALISHHFGSKHGLRTAIELYVVSCFENAASHAAEYHPSEKVSAERIAEGLEQVLHAHPDIRHYIRRAASEANAAMGGAGLIDLLLGSVRSVLTRAGLVASDRNGERQSLQLFLLVFGPTILEPILQRHMPDLFAPHATPGRLFSNVQPLPGNPPPRPIAAAPASSAFAGPAGSLARATVAA